MNRRYVCLRCGSECLVPDYMSGRSVVCACSFREMVPFEQWPLRVVARVE